MTFSPFCSNTIILAWSWACPKGTRTSSSKVMILSATQASLTTSGCSMWRVMLVVSSGSTPAFTSSCRLLSCFRQQCRTTRIHWQLRAVSVWCVVKAPIKNSRPSTSSRSGWPSVSAESAARAMERASFSPADLRQQVRIVGYASFWAARYRCAKPREHCCVKTLRSSRTDADDEATAVLRDSKAWKYTTDDMLNTKHASLCGSEGSSAAKKILILSKLPLSKVYTPLSLNTVCHLLDDPWLFYI